MTLPSQPEPGFNHHVSVWWGHALTLLGEGAALAILVVTYFYIWRSSAQWPPARTPLPDLGVATLDLAILVVSILPMWYAVRLARRHDRPRVLGSLLLACALFGIAALILRVMEFRAVHTGWISNAYGAIVWAILAVHLAHVLAATLETLVIGITMLRGPVNEWHRNDVILNAAYWYFVALSWVALYAVVFLAPRLS